MAGNENVWPDIYPNFEDRREPIAPTVRLVWTEEADQQLGLPEYETAGAAGADLKANFADRGTITLYPGEPTLIPTGFYVAVQSGYELQVRPRSGLALKNGITVPNSPGTVDCDYRGKLGVILLNTGDVPFEVKHGDRIAQAVISPVVQGFFAAVDALDETKRGTGGFGSTGV